MKKLFCTLLVISLLLGGCAKTVPNQPVDNPIVCERDEEASKQLQDILLRSFITDLSTSKMSAHYAIEDLSAYGLENMEVSMGDPREEFDFSVMHQTIAEMKTINYEGLTDKEKNLYNRYLTFLELNVQYEGLDEYSFAFSPYSGAQDNLITSFTEFELRCKEDIDDVIVYLKQVPAFIQALLDDTKDKFEKGIYQNDTIIDGIIDSTETYISKTGEDNRIYMALSSQIDSMDLSDEQKKNYKSQILDAVDNYFIEAYKNIIDVYQGLKGTATTDGCLYEWENGRAYYEVLLKDKASTDKAPQEIAQDLLHEIDSEWNRLIALYMKHTDIIDEWMTSSTQSYGNANDILKNLEMYIQSNFPLVDGINYSVDYLDSTSVSSSVAAYYLNPTMDNFNKNVMKVNPTVEEDLDLFTTLAHEGFPGHCYQNMYELHNNYHPILYYMNFTGYTEGWAVYAQMQSLKYVMENEQLAEFTAINDALTYLVLSYVDVMVNGCGWTIDECIAYCDDWGFDGEHMYYLVIGDPAMYVPYGYGYLQQKQMREYAESKLQDRFDEKEYNKVILDCGFSMYEYVKQQVDKYIASK